MDRGEGTDLYHTVRNYIYFISLFAFFFVSQSKEQIERVWEQIGVENIWM